MPFSCGHCGQLYDLRSAGKLHEAEHGVAFEANEDDDCINCGTSIQRGARVITKSDGKTAHTVHFECPEPAADDEHKEEFPLKVEDSNVVHVPVPQGHASATADGEGLVSGGR